MDDLLGALFLVLTFAAPITGYHFAARDPRRTRMQIIIGSTLGGASVALLLLTFAMVMPAREITVPVAVPYAIYCIAIGAFAGIAGLAARQLGAWLSKRP